MHRLGRRHGTQDGRAQCGRWLQNLAILRRLALNLLRKTTLNRSRRRKIKLASWDGAFLGSTLTQMR